MNYTPKSVFTRKNADGNKITTFEWDYNTWAELEAFKDIYLLLIGLLISAILPLIILVFAILYFNGRSKGLYIIGIILSGYFLYDCNHGWIVLCAINIFFEESTINYLVGLNVAAFILFSLFLIAGGFIHDIIEANFNVVLDRWLVFLTIVAILGIVSFCVTVNTIKVKKGWIETNIKTESEWAKKERLEQERLDEIGSFESLEARKKYFDEMQKKYGN